MKRVLRVRYVLPFILLLAFALIIVSAVAISQYSGSDNGKTITVKSGELFTISLDENPSTGYSWNMTVGSGLQIVNDQYVAKPTQGMVVGSGGYHIWMIKAASPGTYKISGIYKRPWEPVTGDEQRYSMTVVVVGDAGGFIVPSISPPTIKPIKGLLDIKPGFEKVISDMNSIYKQFPKFDLFSLY